MASMNIFTPVPLTAGGRNRTSYFPRRRHKSVSFAANSPESPPEIELEFIGPKSEGEGSYPVDKAKAISGEKLLRNIMVDNKIELYATYIGRSASISKRFNEDLGINVADPEAWGKLMNCGGGGSCGTCIVEIIEGKDLLNERTNTELRYLKKKPESWRLACQTIVGNKENCGKVVVQRIPQWKK